MKKIFIYILLTIFFNISIYAQTMIEMLNPNDANIILLQVNDSNDADVIIYLTKVKEEYQTWDCMWKIKKGGWSNFSFYLTQDENDPLLFTDDDEKPIPISGKIYFTENKNLRGYRNNKFHLDGMMKVHRLK